MIHLVMVFRRRSGNNIRPVHRIKHVIDQQSALAAGTQLDASLVTTVDAPVLASTDQVETGCTINGIFLVVEVLATSSAALPNIYLQIFKNPGGNLTIPTPNTVGANDNKKYVIHQEMVMLQRQTGSNPRTLFKGVIVIPKVYRRFAINDTLVISTLAPGVTTEVCFQCHYKEFR